MYIRQTQNTSQILQKHTKPSSKNSTITAVETYNSMIRISLVRLPSLPFLIIHKNTKLTQFPDFCSEKMLAGFEEDGEDADALLASYINLYNQCILRRPSDMHVGIHLCRGNFVNGRHFSEGSYDRIAKQLFQDLEVNTYYLEYDTPRAGGFEPLKFLPANKNVILGLVTSKFPELEDLEELKGRVEGALQMVMQGMGEEREEVLKRVGVSPQCGFASHSDGNNVGHEEMVAKLKLVRKLADEIWPGEP